METWKPVKNFENHYEVSNKGNVRSVDRFVKHYKGGFRFYKGKDKKITLKHDGYFKCILKKDSERFDFRVHRLVAESFLSNDKNKPFVNHKNGIKTDNRVENLEWVTAEENSIHAVKKRLIKTKLTDNQALEIFHSELSNRKLAKIYNINAIIVWRIKNKKAYKHLFI